MSDYHDRAGKPITLQEYGQLIEDVNAKRVAETVLPNGYWVSTIWLGLNHAFGHGPPLIFETMVFVCDADGHAKNWQEQDSDRYSAEAEALAGHERMVDAWKDRPPADEGEWLRDQVKKARKEKA
jgi:hypothetical protein